MDDQLFKLNGRVWVETAAGKVLGVGRVELLERIKASGSIRQAALQMKMSYKQAWDMINHMNEQYPSPLVSVQRGGKGGGSAMVTGEGLKIIAQYQLVQQQFQIFLAKISKDLQP